MRSKKFFYKDSTEARAEVVLEGGEGDPVYFWKVRPNTQAEGQGIEVGDELVQVNKVPSEVMFEKPAEEILMVRGPVVLAWKKTPKPASSERTRIYRKAKKDDDSDDEDSWVEPYPLSKSDGLPDHMWSCGSCGATNNDRQEFCRRCGMRDTRLPARPGKPGETESSGFFFPTSTLTKKDVLKTATEGLRIKQKEVWTKPVFKYKATGEIEEAD